MKLIKLKRPLWHGTRASVLKFIMKEGLHVGEGERGWDETNWKPGVAYLGKHKRLASHGVYLTNRLASAIAFGQGNEDGEDTYVSKSQTAVIEIVALPSNVRLGHDGFGSYMTDHNIPPQCFGRVLSYRQAKELLKRIGEIR
jgi:hypothetical protein